MVIKRYKKAYVKIEARLIPSGGGGGGTTVVAHSLLDNAPADVTATTGNALNININASGVFSGT